MYQGIIGIRPIKEGNLEFLHLIIETSKQLAKTLANAPHCTLLSRTEVAQLIQLLEQQDDSNANVIASRVLSLVATIRRQYESSALSPELYVNTELPALPRQYDTITVLFGPTMGLGDQITFYQLLYRVTRQYPRAALKIFTLYPSLWPRLLPGAQESHYRAQPLKPFLELANDGNGRRELVIAADFERFDLHRKIIPHKPNRDILDIALGRRSAWLNRGDSPWIYCEIYPRASIPNNYSLAATIGDRILNHKTGQSLWNPLAIEQPSPRNPLRILINPFTSKRLHFEPRDWARLMQRVRAMIPRRIGLELVLYPGLDDVTRRYASTVCQYVRNSNKPIPARLLDDNKESLTPLTALTELTNELKNIDLCVTMDTFTAHLVPLFKIPTVTFVYAENRAFWVPGRWSFHCFLNSANGTAAALIANIIAVISAPPKLARPLREAIGELTRATTQLIDEVLTPLRLTNLAFALAQVIQRIETGFPYLNQAKEWLMLWSRLALAVDQESVDETSIRPYLSRWIDSETYKLLALDLPR
jgi:hypothetical protein